MYLLWEKSRQKGLKVAKYWKSRSCVWDAGADGSRWWILLQPATDKERESLSEGVWTVLKHTERPAQVKSMCGETLELCLLGCLLGNWWLYSKCLYNYGVLIVNIFKSYMRWPCCSISWASTHWVNSNMKRLHETNDEQIYNRERI